MSVMSEPKLQPPGAGLPWPQRVLLRYVVGPLVSKRVPLKKSRADYEKITQRLIEAIDRIPSELRQIKKLVPKQRGLEDSSRFWSLDGVIEHLLIVSQSIERGILELSEGKKPSVKADIAAVKPTHLRSDPFSEFKSYAPELLRRIDTKLSLDQMEKFSHITLNHPWFGELNARQWYWLLSVHQGIHYQQAIEIIKQLK